MKKSQEYFNILEALGDGVITVDKDNRLDYINKKAIEIIGKEPSPKEEIYRFFNVKTEKKGEIIKQVITEVKDTGNTRGLEKGAYIDVPKKGKRYISASVTRIETDNNYKVVLSIRDVTNLIQLENENIEQKNNLEVINNALPLGLIVLDKEQKVVKINHFINNTFNVRDFREGDQRLGEILKCSNANENVCGSSENCGGCEIRRNILLIKNGEKSYINKRVQFKHSFNGQDVYRDYQVGFIKIRNHEEIQTLMILQDITEQIKYEETIKKAKDDAVEANRLKSEFLSNMSHEIRTPLNGIIGMVDLTRIKLEDPELIDNMDIAKSSSINLLNIINSILDISKIEAGKLTLIKKAFQLDKIFEEIEKENKFKAKEKNIQFEIKRKSRFKGQIISDPIRIKQVLTNLVDNAIKFTEEGEVTVSYSLIKDETGLYELDVHVEDTGIGINQGFKETIFDSFTQADGSYTRKVGGTGLGLAISKKIIGLLGGVLDFTSKENRGSDFFFKIPIEIERQNSLNTLTILNDTQSDIQHYLNSNSKETSGNILVVEDDTINQKIVKKQLEKMGHNVDVAENGKEAIEKFDKETLYDMILMDIQMPIMSGIEATDIIRKSERGKKIPIIALTALALKEDRDKIIEHDFNFYLTKPIELNKLAKIVQIVLRGDNLKIENDDLNDTIGTYNTEIEEEKEFILKDHVIMMQKLFLDNCYETLEEKAQVLVNYYESIQNEDKKLLTFKLIMNIRKEKWSNCSALLEEIGSEII